MTTRTQRLTSINEAIALGGGILSFSRALGVSHQAVTGWRKRGYIPLSRALRVEQLFGVSRAAIVAPEIAAALAPLSESVTDLL